MVRLYLMVLLVLCAFVAVGLTHQTQPDVLVAPAVSTQDTAGVEERVQQLEQKVQSLEKSHALAIQINQDLDRRLSKVEGCHD